MLSLERIEKRLVSSTCSILMERYSFLNDNLMFHLSNKAFNLMKRAQNGSCRNNISKPKIVHLHNLQEPLTHMKGNLTRCLQMAIYLIAENFR